MKAMVYIKKFACDDLSLKEFQQEWARMSQSEQEKLREWARDEAIAKGDKDIIVE